MVALERANVPVERYVSYEIDKYANTITAKNYPNIELRGDVKTADFTEFADFDLVIGGFPCQDLSCANKNREGLKGKRSGLFSELVRAINETRPKYFLVENVYSMKKSDRNMITDILNIEPICINSALVSAQNRNRLYWTNIPGITQPKDKGILLCDILEKDVDRRYFFSEDVCKRSFERMRQRIAKHNLTYDYKPKSPPYQCKAKCVAAHNAKSIDGLQNIIETENGEIRCLTPLEYERLQTLPDGYTEGVSNTQRYKCIGNGWTVDVIAHIFKHIESV